MFGRVQAYLWGITVLLALGTIHLGERDPDQALRMHGTAVAVGLLAVLHLVLAPASRGAGHGPPTAEDALRERHLCPRCLHPNRVSRIRCRRCLAPVGWQATWLPYEETVSRWWGVGALLSERSPGRVHVVAASAFVLATVGEYVLPYMADDGDTTWWAVGSPAGLGQLLVEGFLAVVLLVGLVRVTRAFVRDPRPRPQDLPPD